MSLRRYFHAIISQRRLRLLFIHAAAVARLRRATMLRRTCFCRDAFDYAAIFATLLLCCALRCCHMKDYAAARDARFYAIVFSRASAAAITCATQRLPLLLLMPGYAICYAIAARYISLPLIIFLITDAPPPVIYASADMMFAAADARPLFARFDADERYAERFFTSHDYAP